MTILRDVPVSLSALDLLEAQHRRDRPLRALARLSGTAEEAVALARRLATPAAVYREMAVVEVRGGAVRVQTGNERAVLHIGDKADLLAPARRLIVAAYTIGPRLEERVGELLRSGDHLLGYLLDSAGVTILGAVGEAVRDVAAARAREAGWRTGPVLSPGSLVGWPVEGQRELCSLLPLEEIGVRLNAQCVLQPQKSATLVIGWGPDYEEQHSKSICRFCSLADRCWRRREG